MSDVRDLVGDVEPDELDRLQRVHTLLERAGPPPSLSPGLARPPVPGGDVIEFPRRYGYLAAAGAIAAAVLLFVAGYLVGDSGPDTFRTIAMSGSGGATATLVLYDVDASGNWPMRLQVAGLSDGRYALWLTRGDELAELCGTFAVAATETSVPLNAPYRLRDFDGWVVVPVGGTRPVLTT
jgi:hypothetical protein